MQPTTRPRRIRRSRILVPASQPRLVEKSRAIEADIVLFDLEDAVPAEEHLKRQARDLVVSVVREGGFKARELVVRVNDVDTRWFLEDMPAVIDAGIETIALPHARGLRDVLFAEGLAVACASGRDVNLMLQVETPRALFEIEDIARWSTTLSAVSLGAADFALEMGSRAFIRGRNRGSTHVQFALQKLLHVARAVGWNASDSVGGARADDLEGVRAAMIASRDLGFDGVATMYPSHVPIANEVFGVSDDDLAWALETIAVYEAREPGRAVTKSDGYIVLPAHYECALRLRELHAALTSPAAASV